MYERFYGFSERPFSLLPDPAFLYPSRRHATALAVLEYGISSQAGITVLTGEIGSGKTTLLRHLLNRLGDETAVGLITNTHSSLGDLLEWVLLAFGLEFRGMGKAEMYRAFVEFVVGQYARGRRTLLIVDEAQNMTLRLLEELRVLSNVNADKDQVVQLLLVGQPALRAALRRPELEQFAQRVVVDYHLEPLEEAETEAYIDHRLSVAGAGPGVFDREAKRLIHARARGVPRLVNRLCDLSLVYGFGAGRQPVDAPLVEEVLRDQARAEQAGRAGAAPGGGARRAERPVGAGPARAGAARVAQPPACAPVDAVGPVTAAEE